MSILDLFGFERNESNSLEQLCINWSSEKLQHFYMQTVFHDTLNSCQSVSSLPLSFHYPPPHSFPVLCHSSHICACIQLYCLSSLPLSPPPPLSLPPPPPPHPPLLTGKKVWIHYLRVKCTIVSLVLN